MTTTSSEQIRAIQEQAEAEFIQYGPADEGGAPIAATFQQYEAEYGAIRARVGVMHTPQRGVIELRGSDRADFLQRLLTNDVLQLRPGQSRRAMLLNHQGRIQADILVLQDAEVTRLLLDRLDVQRTLAALDAKLFSEDVTMCDASGEVEAFVLHGPAALRLAAAVAGRELRGLGDREHRQEALAEQGVTIVRHDEAGVLGLHLLVPAGGAAGFYQRLLDEAGFVPGEDVADADHAERRRQTLRGRPVGWLAYNTARIEAGTALYHIDFGPDALPGELGEAALSERVSFTKGCYLGQEIVARMKSLGHPKRVLAGLRFEGDALPVAGATVHELPAPDAPSTSGAQVGVVTSSTLSPMLGNVAIALAQMKWNWHTAGREVVAPAEGAMARAKVHAPRFV